MENPFWEYSLARYEAHGVSSACLRLQDEFAMDVNLLLYAGWLAQEEQQLSEPHFGELDALIADWRVSVVSPLRDLRKRLRGFPAATGIREEIKSLELRAERQQQDLMYGYHQRASALPKVKGSLVSNLTLVARHSHPRDGEWQAAIHHLVGLLSP